MGSRRYQGDREAAWTALLHAQARIINRLAGDLDAAGMIPLGTYDVLVQLSENRGRLRLKDLVHRVVLSQPGLSRKVARLEDEGLVERLADPTDGRGVIVHITRAGRSALRRASGLHIPGIEREFTSRITDQEAAVLAVVFGRLLEDPSPADGAAAQGPPNPIEPATATGNGAVDAGAGRTAARAGAAGGSRPATTGGPRRRGPR
ncbi:MAG TPA: MarR family transcriptional regulator [Nakamurella sp.]|nr:MarR family transcriptional regulator [Nakamurella sp.]